jgi:carboxymethylenebutenolidase
VHETPSNQLAKEAIRMGEMVQFKRPDGKECSGYLVEPPPGKTAPGVVVIQEWWGLNEQIRGVARDLVAAGYRALIPDLYRGKVTLEVAEAEHLMSDLDFLDAAQQDIRGALQELKRTSAKVGAIGFCMGGALSILTAVYAPEVDAVVDWYGVPPEEAGDTRTIRAALQGHFALDDAFFPITQVDALEKRLTEARVPHEFFRYKANHAFGNETGPNHDATLKKQAWERSLAFLEKNLKS